VTAVSDEQKGERLVVLYTHAEFTPDLLWEQLQQRDLPKLWIPKREHFYRVESSLCWAPAKLISTPPEPRRWRCWFIGFLIHVCRRQQILLSVMRVRRHQRRCDYPRPRVALSHSPYLAKAASQPPRSKEEETAREFMRHDTQHAPTHVNQIDGSCRCSPYTYCSLTLQQERSCYD
jgi:hypothetical protein